VKNMSAVRAPSPGRISMTRSMRERMSKGFSCHP
jgi:hypothetical protein